MTFVLHQLRTDLLHLRGWLLAWLLLLAAATAVSAFRLDMLAGSAESAGRLLGAHALALDALVVMSWILAARVIHADPLDGTTAFWLTRPISPARLAAAKLTLVLLLFVIVPTILAAVGAAGNGMRGALLVRAWAEAALVHLAFVLGIVLLATLTRDVARLVLASIAAAAMWVTLHAVFHYSLNAASALDRALLRYSGLLAGLLAGCVGCLAIVVGQFLSRNARRSVALVLVLSLGIIGVVNLWRWDILGLRRAVRPGSFDDSAWRVQLQEDERRAFSGSEHYVQGRFVVDRAPAGWAVIPLHIDATLRLEDGTTVPFADDTWLAPAGLDENSAVFGFGGQAFDAAGAVLPGRWLNAPRQEAIDEAGGGRRHWVSIALMKLPSRISSGRANRGTYEATVLCSAYRARIVARVPCREGGALRLGESETSLMGVRHVSTAGGSDELRLDVRTATSPLLFPRLAPGIVHVLRNQPRGDMLIGFDRSSVRSSLRLLAGGGLQVRYAEIDFSPARNQPLELDAGWLAEAEVVAIAFEPQGVFTRTMRIADFRLRDEAPAAEKQ